MLNSLGEMLYCVCLRDGSGVSLATIFDGDRFIFCSALFSHRRASLIELRSNEVFIVECGDSTSGMEHFEVKIALKNNGNVFDKAIESSFLEKLR